MRSRPPGQSDTPIGGRARENRLATSIRVLLVDDQRMLREALRAILEQAGDIAVVAEADNGATALELAREFKPDVVVMEMSLKRMSGVEATRRMLAHNPQIKVLGLSALAGRRTMLQMLEAGARGYIAKSAGCEELLRGIRALAQGVSYLYADAAGALVDHLRSDPSRQRRKDALGRREREVLQLLASGRTSAQIATVLDIAIGTVDVHRRNIMRKLDLHNVAELTRYAIREGLSSI